MRCLEVLLSWIFSTTSCLSRGLMVLCATVATSPTASNDTVARRGATLARGSASRIDEMNGRVSLCNASSRKKMMMSRVAISLLPLSPPQRSSIMRSTSTRLNPGRILAGFNLDILPKIWRAPTLIDNASSSSIRNSEPPWFSDRERSYLSSNPRTIQSLTTGDMSETANRNSFCRTSSNRSPETSPNLKRRRDCCSSFSLFESPGPNGRSNRQQVIAASRRTLLEGCSKYIEITSRRKGSNRLPSSDA